MSTSASAARCDRYTEPLDPATGLRARCANTVADPAATGTWCRRCAGYKKARPPKSATAARPTVATTTAAAQPVLVAATESVPADEVAQCSQMLPDIRKDVAAGSQVRCKNAIRTPETHCYRHGGDEAHTLGKTFAKATAEAARGELTVPGEEWRTSTEFRQATYERSIADMLARDPSELVRLEVASARYEKAYGTGRWGRNNRLVAMATIYMRGERAGLEGEDLWEYVDARMREPILTANQWAKLGRTVTTGEELRSILVVSRRRVGPTVRKDGETQAEFEERAAAETRFMPAQMFDEYLLEQTHGKAFAQDTKSPLDTPLPAGYGDPVAVYEAVSGYAESLGVTVTTTAVKPASGAYAYYEPSKNAITVWSGIAGGDPTARLYSLLHELGHAQDPHTDRPCQHGDATYARGELVAESYAYLAMGHFGVDTGDLSKFYVGGESSGWGQRLGENYKAASYSAFTAAMVTVDQLVTALTPTGESATTER